jgi:hypothetical protein
VDTTAEDATAEDDTVELFKKRVDATAEPHDTHITMDATAERQGGALVTTTITMLSIL